MSDSERCESSSVVELWLPKPIMGVRFPSLALVLIFAFYILSFSGCASSPVSLAHNMPGIYHRMQKGETLWRISKIYNVNLNELISINRISDTTDIEIGQAIFIPKKTDRQEVIANSLNLEDFSWPVDNGRVVAGFWQTVNNMINKGINIQPRRNLNVTASRSGRVVFYNPDFHGFGKTLVIEHGEGFSTLYARNSEVFVKAGDKVAKGMVIAKAGSAGRDKDVYLHFEIRKSHIPQNPNFYLP